MNQYYYQFIQKGCIYEIKDLLNMTNLSYNLGNVITYLFRAGFKLESTAEKDIKKAIDHLNYEIEKISIYGFKYDLRKPSIDYIALANDRFKDNHILRSAFCLLIGLTTDKCNLSNYLNTIESTIAILESYLNEYL